LKLSFLIPILLVILLPVPIEAFPFENGTSLCGRVVTGFRAGTDRAALMPNTYGSGSGPALAGTW
jgi:hypothetical protein